MRREAQGIQCLANSSPRYRKLGRTKIERVADSDNEHSRDVLLRTRVLIERDPIVVDVAEDLQGSRRPVVSKLAFEWIGQPDQP